MAGIVSAHAAGGRNRSTCAGLDRHLDMKVTGLIPALSCRACRPHAFAELMKLSPTSIAGELREEHRKRVL
ncbi:MAG: hypothetical protein WBE48_05385, partial [Xanthobacteraceae bacterium]